MTRKSRTVADRQKSLQPVPPEAQFTLAGLRRMHKGIGAEEFRCTISGHCRTQIFEFPQIDFHPNNKESLHTIYMSSSVEACVLSNLVDYFENTTHNRHYAISPPLRHMVAETDKKVRTQQNGGVPVFLVIEEYNELTPVEMLNGECCVSDEVFVQDGKKTPALVGGREGRKFITACAASDGTWPELPENQQLVNMILAGVRVGQQTPDPIRKYVDLSCLVTDDGRFVMMTRLTASARLGTATIMDSNALRGKALEIRKAIATMEKDMMIPHMALLINSMYSDERKDDSYQRLQYLRLWQSLEETVGTCLGYQGNVRQDNFVVAGKKTLRELNYYRNDIAHWWTDTIDENFLADLQRTINELMSRRYF